MLEYFIFRKEDVNIFYSELTALMATVLRDNIPQSYPSSLPKDYVEKMAGYIEDGSAFIVGAKEGNVLAGFSWAYELKIFDERRFHIDMICVNPSCRKKGIAKQLVAMQMNEAKRRKIHAIEAMTTRKNENSYHWFHSLGFEDERVKVKMQIYMIEKKQSKTENYKIPFLYYKRARDAMLDLVRRYYLQGYQDIYIPGYIGWSPKEGSGIFDPLNAIDCWTANYNRN